MLTRLAPLDARALQERLTAALAQADSLLRQMREIKLALAQSRAKYEAQQGIVADFRIYLVASERHKGARYV